MSDTGWAPKPKLRRIKVKPEAAETVCEICGGKRQMGYDGKQRCRPCINFMLEKYEGVFIAIRRGR